MVIIVILIVTSRPRRRRGQQQRGRSGPWIRIGGGTVHEMMVH